jgi:hypothetical protein
LDGWFLSKPEWDALGHALAKLTKLSKLDLSTMRNTDGCAAALPHLTHLAAMQHLELRLHERDTESAAAPLRCMPALQSLFVKCNLTGDTSVLGALAGVCGGTLTGLRLARCRAAPLAAALHHLTALRDLEAAIAPLDQGVQHAQDEPMALVAASLTACTALSELCLAGHGVDWAPLAAALPSLVCLESLTLHAHFTPADLVALAPAFAKLAATLRNLFLAKCDIRPAGMSALAAALGQLTSLCTLCLDDNPLGSLGAAHLAEQALPSLTALQFLDLSRTGFDGSALRAWLALRPASLRSASYFFPTCVATPPAWSRLHAP